MHKFILIDMLKTYSDSNLNRDDLGRPKSSNFGNINRTRVSSQSLKRAWRTSDTFEKITDGGIGVRSRFNIKKVVTEACEVVGISEENKIIEIQKEVLSQFSKKKDKVPYEYDEKNKKVSLKTVTFLSKSEIKNVEKEIQRILSGEKEKIQILDNSTADIDMAMFGRMMAESKENDIQAAVQVSQSITVHGQSPQIDYFTAVDDLDSNGSAHIGEFEFSSGVFHQYVSINVNLLLSNLNGDTKMANKAINGLISSMAKVSPGGKQNTFASQSVADYILLRKTDDTPFSLVNAFTSGVKGSNLVEKSIESIEEYHATAKEKFEIEEDSMSFNLLKKDGVKFSQLIDFALIK